ncbi:MAG: hypothetical protein CML66_23650 [Rhodobacteraceae bacterium]|nr:hypothetical protein [Paracoccaceae bacterium]QEW22809.1 putative membrane protein [Marinibacterium anthonyi]|tara:strand:+ start:146 stop:739 length:594 start_codon:yes stop_codon:yes gene_type:complete
MKSLAALLVAALASPALADPPFPWIYDVQGVGEGDVLNIRADASSTAEVIASLPPDATGVEAVAVNDNGYWLRIALPESTGWAAAGYLKPRPRDPDYAFTRALTCGGTEPFWGLRVVQDDSAVLILMGEDDATLPAHRLRPGKDHKDRFTLSLGDSSAALISVQQCSDGMSDRIYGLKINLTINKQKPLSGCCSLVP